MYIYCIRLQINKHVCLSSRLVLQKLEISAESYDTVQLKTV